MPTDRSLLLIATLAACWSQSAPAKLPRLSDPIPAQLAIVDDREVRVVEVSPGGAKLLRSAKVPAPVETLEWVGADPVVLLQRHGLDNCGMPEDAYRSHAAYEAAEHNCTADPKLDGTIGRVAPTGFVPYAALPESTWAVMSDHSKDGEPCTTGCWSLAVTGSGDVWQGHCKWMFSADGSDHCLEWYYARIDRPGPAVKEQPERRLPPALPSVPASPRVKVTFSRATPPPHFESDEPEPRRQLRCELAGRTVEYPELNELDAGMQKEVVWLATEPPMFAAWHGHDGLIGSSELIVFERCKPTKYAKLVTGPNELVALVRDTVEVRRRGELVGVTDGSQLVAFAPK
jgi:hypothetical protein